MKSDASGKQVEDYWAASKKVNSDRSKLLYPLITELLNELSSQRVYPDFIHKSNILNL